MKLNRVVFVLSILAIIAASGCAHRRNQTSDVKGPTPSMYTACPRPDWADNPVCEGGLCAVGIGKSADTSFAREKAEADGRNKLAKALEVEVRNLFEQLREENRDYIDEAASSGFEFTSSVTQHLTNTVMTGSIATNYYTDCVKDEQYVLMVLNFEMLNAQLKQAMAQAAEETHVFNRELKDRAIDRMNALIDARQDAAMGATLAP